MFVWGCGDSFQCNEGVLVGAWDSDHGIGTAGRRSW